MHFKGPKSSIKRKERFKNDSVEQALELKQIALREARVQLMEEEGYSPVQDFVRVGVKSGGID